MNKDDEIVKVLNDIRDVLLHIDIMIEHAFFHQNNDMEH
jgi:hypothetical protein